MRSELRHVVRCGKRQRTRRDNKSWAVRGGITHPCEYRDRTFQSRTRSTALLAGEQCRRGSRSGGLSEKLAEGWSLRSCRESAGAAGRTLGRIVRLLDRQQRMPLRYRHRHSVSRYGRALRRSFPATRPPLPSRLPESNEIAAESGGGAIAFAVRSSELPLQIA